MDASGSDMNEAVLARLDALTTQVAYLVERQRKQEELLDELAFPIARDALRTVTGRLDELEKKGYFTFGAELVKVGRRIVESYSAEDVQALGDAVVGILDTVRAMTRPELLHVMGEAAQVIARADETEPIGLVGMVRATRRDDVQRGMAVLMELLAKVGHGAQVLSEAPSKTEQRKTKLAAALGPRRGRGVLGVERPPPRLPAPPPQATTSSAKPAGAVIDGVAFNADGHLADPAQWTRALGETIAGMCSVAMTEAHWSVVEWARKDWETTKASPNIRRITQGMQLPTKRLYELFPKAPGRTIARIAGIPKPVGCL